MQVNYEDPFSSMWYFGDPSFAKNNATVYYYEGVWKAIQASNFLFLGTMVMFIVDNNIGSRTTSRSDLTEFFDRIDSVQGMNKEIFHEQFYDEFISLFSTAMDTVRSLNENKL